MKNNFKVGDRVIATVGVDPEFLIGKPAVIVWVGHKLIECNFVSKELQRHNGVYLYYRFIKCKNADDQKICKIKKC